MSLPSYTAADWPDYWDDRSYDYTVHLTRQDWAWEFLRRNPEFRLDLAQALKRAGDLEYRTSLDIVVSRLDLARWGIIFRRFLWA
jgi:hypothetical protein